MDPLDCSCCDEAHGMWLPALSLWWAKRRIWGAAQAGSAECTGRCSLVAAKSGAESLSPQPSVLSAPRAMEGAYWSRWFSDCIVHTLNALSAVLCCKSILGEKKNKYSSHQMSVILSAGLFQLFSSPCDCTWLHLLRKLTSVKKYFRAWTRVFLL